MLLDQKSKNLLLIERAANDLRKGFPVIIKNGSDNIFAISTETASIDFIKKILDIHSSLDLIVTPNRLKYISDNNQTTSCTAIPITNDNINDIAKISGIDKFDIDKISNYKETKEVDKAALDLVKIAELMPSVITCKTNCIDDDEFIKIEKDDIYSYKQQISYQLTEACRTNLVLKHTIDAKIIAYRPNIGGKEHYAIIIGNITDNPLVRVHSSCFTGDLLESLACDCRDQLHQAIDKMHQESGGIILYMLQEGRGIGLINKLRAYTLKEQGLDTVDANESLGFDDDERLFLPAAEMLKKMNIKQVRLLSNNPKKALGLEECGITVTECVPHIMDTNEHNKYYMDTKSARLGHKLDND